jgi:hypothetical protein
MGTPARAHGVGTPSLYSGEVQEDWDPRGSRRLVCIKEKLYKECIADLGYEFVPNQDSETHPPIKEDMRSDAGR